MFGCMHSDYAGSPSQSLKSQSSSVMFKSLMGKCDKCTCIISVSAGKFEMWCLEALKWSKGYISGLLKTFSKGWQVYMKLTVENKILQNKILYN